MSDNDPMIGSFIFGISLGILFILFIVGSVRDSEMDKIKSECVQRGVAQWVTGEDNKPKFEWKNKDDLHSSE